VEVESEEALSFALQAFVETKLDFVDSLLYGFSAAYGYNVFTFDKKLHSKIYKLN
jgi:predicted nucleic-acid-binding protein